MTKARRSSKLASNPRPENIITQECDCGPQVLTLGPFKSPEHEMRVKQQLLDAFAKLLVEQWRRDQEKNEV